MTNLDQYIRDHRDEFDISEPEPGHFERFEARLSTQPVRQPVVFDRSLLLKVAAAIVILITVSVFVFDLATRGIREQLAAEGQGSGLPREIAEAVQYYDNQTATQMETLKTMAVTREDAREISGSAMKELRNLDATTSGLRDALATDPGNERILDAIIRNQQMKEAMLNTIITKLSNHHN